MRMVMPDKPCREIEVQGAQTGRTTRYVPGSDATVEVNNPRHIRALREAGCFPANLGGTPHTAGHRCPACGFASYFTTCGRCGAGITSTAKVA